MNTDYQGHQMNLQGWATPLKPLKIVKPTVTPESKGYNPEYHAYITERNRAFDADKEVIDGEGISKYYPEIAQVIRMAAIDGVKFHNIDDQSIDVCGSFMYPDFVFCFWEAVKVRCDSKDNIQARVFMLFVAEALC